jgi:hypothetical protein
MDQMMENAADLFLQASRNSTLTPNLTTLLMVCEASDITEWTTSNNARVAGTDNDATEDDTTTEALSDEWYASLPPEQRAVVDEGIEAMIQAG